MAPALSDLLPPLYLPDLSLTSVPTDLSQPSSLLAVPQRCPLPFGLLFPLPGSPFPAPPASPSALHLDVTSLLSPKSHPQVSPMLHPLTDFLVLISIIMRTLFSFTRWLTYALCPLGAHMDPFYLVLRGVQSRAQGLARGGCSISIDAPCGYIRMRRDGGASVIDHCYLAAALFFPSSLTASLPGQNYYPHVTTGETEAQRNAVTLPRPLQREGAGCGFEAKPQTAGNTGNRMTKISEAGVGLGYTHLSRSCVL